MGKVTIIQSLKNLSIDSCSSINKKIALIFERVPYPGEARTHGLQIMRLTRCLLRYGGLVIEWEKFCFQESRRSSPNWILKENMNSNLKWYSLSIAKEVLKGYVWTLSIPFFYKNDLQWKFLCNCLLSLLEQRNSPFTSTTYLMLFSISISGIELIANDTKVSEIKYILCFHIRFD